jgi:hypothetical protein
MSERTFSTKAGVVFPAVTAVFIILDRRSTRLYLPNHTINHRKIRLTESNAKGSYLKN